ncbi:MAG: 3'-5' exonuclease [Melioribacteraceae bacterium]|nr:3'-5' exonuclease [Melioribacteraceae bacterium]
MSDKIFFYDLETTGLSQDCAIHQLSGMFFDIQQWNVVDSINLFARPHVGARIEYGALEICGITKEQLYSYPTPESMYKRLVDSLSAHVKKFDPNDKMFLGGFNNHKFDDEVLKRFFILNNDKFFNSFFYSAPVVDTYHLASKTLLLRRKYMPNFKLSTVAKFLGIEVKEEELHDAKYDLELTINIFKKTSEIHGILSLEGLNIGDLMNKLTIAREERKQQIKEYKNSEYFIYNG